MGMTRITTARICGFAFLLYIVAGISQMMFSRSGAAAQIAIFIQRASAVTPGTALMWLPMAGFEIPLGVWLLLKGVQHEPQDRPVTTV